MERLKKIPYFPFWLCAAAFLLLALLPNYTYVRLVPLTIGILIAAWCGLGLLARCQPEAARIFRSLLVTALFLGLLIFSITGTMIIKAGTQTPPENCEYIVVLGAQVRNSGPSATLQERIDAAYDYLVQNPDTIAIVTGGKGGDEPISEAECMFNSLTRRGIDPNRIWLEEKDTSTWENLKFSLDIIEEKTGHRPTSIGVVSSEFHLYRTARQCADRGLTIQGIPAKTGNPERFLHYFLREICGVWHYLILGGRYT